MARWIVRAAVSVLVAALLFTIIPLGTVVDALRRVSPWTWAASLAIFFGGHYLNAMKLRLLLGPDAPPLSVCVQGQYAGLAANLGLPGLAGGDLVRAAYLVPAAGLTRVTLASVADRLLDTGTLLLMIAIALPIAGVPALVADVVWPGGAWLVAAVLVAAAAVALVALGARRTRFARALAQARTALAARRSAWIRAAAISLGVQSAFVLTNVWLARQVGVMTGLAAWFVAWPLSKLIAVLPISLGGIGVREAALVSLLTPYGASGDAVLASGLLWQGILAVSGLTGLAITQWWRGRVPARSSMKSSEEKA
jgi:uncharacterized membrane protein YbhN (UPF0104 family)